MFFENQIIISNCNDLNLDFKDNLTKRNSIIIKNCNKVKINLNSKINKLIFINSNNITLKCSETISGIDIEKCFNFILDPIEPYQLGYVECYKSYIQIIFNDNLINKFKIINEESHIEIIN